MSDPVLSAEQREAIARAIHRGYVVAARADGQTVASNPSIVDWRDLPDTLRESNRAQADDIIEKLATIACTIVDADRVSTPFAFSDHEVEVLARAEHERWWRDRQRDGWRLGPVKDAEHKQHPDLVPWDDLTDAARELDRNAVRGIPAVLAAADLAIARTEETP